MGGVRLRLTTSETLLSAGLVAWGLSEAVALPSDSPLAARVVLALLATVPLAFRNAAPGIVMAWTLLILGVQEVADLLPVTGVTPYQCVCLATYALAASERRGRAGWWVSVSLVVIFPAFLLALDSDHSYELVHAVATGFGQLTIVVAGAMVRGRRVQAARADELLRAEGRAAPARLAAALTTERDLMARDLNAIVASDLREIDEQLRAARHALKSGDAAAARGGAEAVQSTAAQAVMEMRRLLEALGGDAVGADEPGPPEGSDAADRRAQWRRDRVADAAVLVPLVALLVVELGKAPSDRVALSALAGVVFLIGPAAVRRRWPFSVACVVAFGLVARHLADLIPALPVTLMPTLIFSAYALAAFAPSRRATGGVLVLALGGLGLVTMTLDHGGAWPDLPVVLFVIGCAYAAGELVRENDGRILTLRAGAAELAAGHRRRRAQALERERQQVARELHDVVAHGVSLIAVQAGAAAATAERDPAAAGRALGFAIDAIAHTRADLRRLTAVLGALPAPEVPGAEDLPALVERVRRSGQVVDLEVDGTLAGVAPDVGVSVYRIVQESLTNARKHAGGAPTAVRLQASHEAVTVEVETAPPGVRGAAASSVSGSTPRPAVLLNTGRGIAGMRERARLLGGDLEAEPTAEGGFRVCAVLPR